MYLFLGKRLLFVIFLITSSFCCAQNEGQISAGLGLDYGFGKSLNNRASSVRFNYNFIKDFRMAPSFSYYVNKNDMKMRLFSLNLHYMFDDLVSDVIPAMKNQGLRFYSLAGLSVASVSKNKKVCSSCFTNGFSANSGYVPNYGFDFGVGVEYELPTLLPIFRDMDAVFEIQHHILDNFSRPSFVFGLMYNF